MKNPYHIEGPALISVSGGRTSGFMLRQIIDAHGGKLPSYVIPVFCNTGKAWLVSGLDTLMLEWACTFDWRRKRKETGDGREG